MKAPAAAGAPTTSEQPDRGLGRLLLVLVLAAWALVVAGGTVRVSESGVGCPDWPLCGGRVVPAGKVAPIVEYSHRAAAAVVIALLVAAVAWAWRRRDDQPGVVAPLVIALGLVPVQALLGAVVVWLELPDRLVGVHFMIGMVMLGLCTIAAARSWRLQPVVSQFFRRVTATLGIAALVLVSLGAGVVSTDAMHACGEHWPDCNGGVATGGRLAVLQVVHRTTAYVVAGLALVLLLLGLRGHAPRLLASLPAAISLAQIGFGIGLILSAHGSVQHDAFRVLHVAGAAALWVSVVTVVSIVISAPASAARGTTRQLDSRLAVGVIVAVALPFLLSATLVAKAGGSGVVTGTIWVANEGGDSITAIDANTHAVVTILRGIKAPHNVQVSPNGDTLWATSPPTGTVAVIDSQALVVRGTVATGSDPAHVVLTPDGGTALVTNAGDDTLAIIDTSTLEVVRRIRTGSYPHGIRPSPDGASALLANLGGSTVESVAVDAPGVLGRVDVGSAPVQVAYAPGGRFAYATVNAANEVVKIDMQRLEVLGRTRVSRGPVQLATTPDGSLLVVASQGTAARPSRTASLIDTTTMRVTKTLSTGSGAHGVTVEPNGQQAFVTNVWAGDVAVIDLVESRVVDRIPVGGEPNGITYSPTTQPHARSAANMGSPREVVLPLGGSVDGSGSGGHHH